MDIWILQPALSSTFSLLFAIVAKTAFDYSMRSCEFPGRGYNEAKTQRPKIDVAAFDTCKGTLI